MSESSLLRWWVRRLFRMLVGVVLGTTVVMYLYFWGFGLFRSDSLMFQPSFASYDDTEDILQIPVGEGEWISARWMPAEDARFTVFHHHGTADETIPIWHGRALFERAQEPKMAAWIDGAGHDDMLFTGKEPYWRAWEEFADLCGDGP